MTEADAERGAIEAEYQQRLAHWNAGGRTYPRPRRRLTAAQRERRRERRKWRESWCRPGDAPSPGHMKKRYSR